MSNKLRLKFDPNTIQHLGVSLYSQLPSVIAELVSNSWDADADNVIVDFIESGDQKSIAYTDDGVGMTFEELNDSYLLIGRNRRIAASEITLKGRKVTGKKGLGKLAVFGICNEIIVKTIKSGILNEFSMNIEDIKKSAKGEYEPTVIQYNVATADKNGTSIILNQIKRKSSFNHEGIASGLSKKFLIFDRMNTTIKHNGTDEIVITNELKFFGFKKEFSWKFPLGFSDISYEKASKVGGEIFTLETPIKDTEMKGIYLTSRGKIVNKADFYDIRDTDQFHTYVTGYLEVDFVDELPEDVISTDRQSLNWETDQTRALKIYLQEIIKKIGSEWRKKRAEKKKETINTEVGLDISAWQNKLPSYEKELSQKIIDPILGNATIDTKESSVIIENVIDKFDNKVFKQYASDIASLDKPEDIPKLLRLMDDWKVIESKQYADLAISRIEVINKFEMYLDTDTKEVPTLHNFFKQFSWLLDPRILEFRDEVRYSKLLKEKFNDDVLDEKDRRIDFLCSNALGGILYVIEIKRSKYKIDEKSLEQGYDYGAFLKDRYATDSSFTQVVVFVVGGEKSGDSKFIRKLSTYSTTGEVFIKTYTELLEQSKEYHKEFIGLYKKST